MDCWLLKKDSTPWSKLVTLSVCGVAYVCTIITRAYTKSKCDVWFSLYRNKLESTSINAHSRRHEGRAFLTSRFRIPVSEWLHVREVYISYCTVLSCDGGGLGVG
jgi:hypothetical protein